MIRWSVARPADTVIVMTRTGKHHLLRPGRMATLCGLYDDDVRFEVVARTSPSLAASTPQCRTCSRVALKEAAS